MKPRELADVVDRIAEALDVIGKGERATWLRNRTADLRQGNVDQIAQARQELAGIVHGMGGLLDFDFGDATGEVDALIDQLWAAVKP